MSRGKRPRTADAGKIPVGVSACLMGEAVRHDGGHKADPYIMNTLGRVFEFHARHRCMIMRHDRTRCRELDRFLARISGENVIELSREYLLRLMDALKPKASRDNHVNVQK